MQTYKSQSLSKPQGFLYYKGNLTLKNIENMEESILDIRAIITDINATTKEELLTLIGHISRMKAELKDNLTNLIDNETN